MNCSNCLREIPDGSKSCLYCEAKQRDLPGSENAVEACELPLKELALAMPESLEILTEVARNADTADDFANSMMVGECPKCGSPKTETCEDVRGIENIFVGRCIECGTLFCSECNQEFEDEQVTVASPTCPFCGSEDTNFPADEDATLDFPEVITCNACNGDYCATCGCPVAVDPDWWEKNHAKW